MASRASILAITTAVLLCLPAAVRAATCVDRVNGSTDNLAQITARMRGQDDAYAWGVAMVQKNIQLLLAQAIIAQNEADTFDTLDALIPANNTKAHAAFQRMREKKKSEAEHLIDQASTTHARLQNVVVALCAQAEGEPNGDQMVRTALDPEAPNNGAPDDPPRDNGPDAGAPPADGPPPDSRRARGDGSDTGPPPGGWPPMNADNGNRDDNRDDNGDAAAAAVGGLLLGGALAGGGGHHHDGGRGNGGAGCH